MRICIPIAENRGLLSPLSPRVETAPMFLLVDTATLAYRTIPYAPGAADDDASPSHALASEVVDAFIVSAAGGSGAAHDLSRSIPVYAAPAGRVADALADLIAGRLQPLPRRLHADLRP